MAVVVTASIAVVALFRFEDVDKVPEATVVLAGPFADEAGDAGLTIEDAVFGDGEA